MPAGLSRRTNQILTNNFEMSKLSTIIQLFTFLKRQKKYWLYPLIIAFIIMGMLIILGENSVLAPFIYSLF